MADIEAIERATLDAVPPQRLLQWQDWLLALDAFCRTLQMQGYAQAKPTLVQTARLASLSLRRGVAAQFALTDAPGPEWEQVFLGDGFDPVDGASRLRILRRGSHSLFASARVQAWGYAYWS